MHISAVDETMLSKRKQREEGGNCVAFTPPNPEQKGRPS
jgi:hypothetical protein